MKQVIPIFVGFDPRESVAYHTFCQSVIDTASQPVSFIPLHKPLLNGFNGQRDGTNAFIFSRYLVPYISRYNGWALFADGDMVVNTDIAKLWEWRDIWFDKACAVVKHDYTTKHPRKYIGTAIENDNVDYPRKNWSSVILWNCNHYANRILTPEYVAEAQPQDIHRFSWLRDDQIGALPIDWNYLVGEYPPGPAHLRHYTLGVSGIPHYVDDHGAMDWHRSLVKSLQCGSVTPSDMVKRAEERVGAIQ